MPGVGNRLAWSSGNGSEGGETAAAYGRGYRGQTLYEAMGQITYPDLNLSHLIQPK
jgi:hypothetical protein